MDELTRQERWSITVLLGAASKAPEMRLHRAGGCVLTTSSIERMFYSSGSALARSQVR